MYQQKLGKLYIIVGVGDIIYVEEYVGVETQQYLVLWVLSWWCDVKIYRSRWRYVRMELKNK